MTACRHSDARPGDTYCRTCGTRLLVGSVPRCQECQYPTRPVDSFCAACGADLPRPEPAAVLHDFKPRAYNPAPPRCEVRDARWRCCLLSSDHVNPHLFTD